MNHSDKYKLCVVIPCYNVSKHIEEVINGLPKEINCVIAVNDCSTDNTISILEHLAASNNSIYIVNHAINQGVGGAMITGYKKSLELGMDITIKMDGDGQMDAANINKLIQPLVEGKADFSKGNRFRDLRALQAMPPVRRIGNLGLSFLIKAASGYWNIFDPTNGFTAIKNETLAAVNFNKLHKRYYFETSMISELYFSNAVIYDVPMQAKYGDEVSRLSSAKTLFEFPPKLLVAFLRRILLKYFLFDFNIGSLYLITGVPLFLYGFMFGLLKYEEYDKLGIGAPTGTVILPTLLIILGFQLLLAGLAFDVNNYPKKQSSS
jgi:glycosyltransferase involved in cell wall biosynthesis